MARAAGPVKDSRLSRKGFEQKGLSLAELGEHQCACVLAMARAWEINGSLREQRGCLRYLVA